MKKNHFSQFAIASVIGLAALSAHGQPMAGTSPNELLDAANNVVRQLDNNQYPTVWRNMAGFVHTAIQEKVFLDRTQRARQAIGTVSQRGWSTVERLVLNGDANTPAGMYGNVDYVTTLSNGKVVIEQLSFRLEDDGKWRLTGYQPQLPQAQAASAGAQSGAAQ